MGYKEDLKENLDESNFTKYLEALDNYIRTHTEGDKNIVLAHYNELSEERKKLALDIADSYQVVLQLASPKPNDTKEKKEKIVKKEIKEIIEHSEWVKNIKLDYTSKEAFKHIENILCQLHTELPTLEIYRLLFTMGILYYQLDSISMDQVNCILTAYLDSPYPITLDQMLVLFKGRIKQLEHDKEQDQKQIQELLEICDLALSLKK